MSLHDAIKGQMTEVKGLRRRRRRTHLLVDFRNRIRYWKLKKKAEDKQMWKL